MNIPIIDLKKQYKAIEGEIKVKINEILEKQAFILGEEVKILEENIAAYCRTKYAVGVNSGTDALLLALRAFGIKRGDEVITTPFTFIATAEAIALLGAKPVFCDIDPLTYNINPDLIKRKITPRTKGIIPVHLYGLSADMDPIMDIARKHNLSVLEDCAQAIGSEYKGRRAGSMGRAGAISFYPGKNLGCFGDGGMVVTNDIKICDAVKLLRNHGSSKSYYHETVGYNTRLDNLQAAVLNIKLKYLDGWIEGRNKNACYFTAELRGLPLTPPVIPKRFRHSFHHYVLRASKASDIINYLIANKIESRSYYPVPLHRQKCFRSLGYKKGDFPEAERFALEAFAIPVYPELSREEKEYIVDRLKNFPENK